MSLEEYSELAKRLINRYGSKWMLQDEYIGLIVENLVRSDMQYKEGYGTKLKTFRMNGFKNSIRKIFYKAHMHKKKSRVGEVDKETSNTYYCEESLVDKKQLQEEERDEYRANVDKMVNEILSSSELTKKEKEYLGLVYVDGKSVMEVAKLYDVTKQAVAGRIASAIKKLKGVYLVESI